MTDIWIHVLPLLLIVAYSALTMALALQVWCRRSVYHVRWLSLALLLSMGMVLRHIVNNETLDTPLLLVLVVVMGCVVRGLSLLPRKRDV